MRKFFKIAAIALVFIFILLWSLPYLFKGRLNDLLRKEISASITGKFDFKDLNVSLIRDFPHVSLAMTEPVCTSFVAQDTSELFKAKEISLSVGLFEILTGKQPLSIKKFGIDGATMLLIQYDSVLANYQLTPLDTTDKSQSSAIQFKIEDYSIENSDIRIIDHLKGQDLLISGLNHSGSFEQLEDRQKLNNTTDIQSLSILNKNIPVLKELKIHAENDLEISENGNSYRMGVSQLRLNDLLLEYSGAIHFSNDLIEFENFEVHSPSTAFKEIFSILPNAYTSDFNKVVSSGNFSLNGKLNGSYSDSSRVYPNWNVELIVSDGLIQYPGKNVSLNEFNLKVRSENQSADMVNSFFEISKFGFSIGNEPFEGKIRIQDLSNAFQTEGSIKAKLSLSKLREFFPLDGGNQLNGNLSLNSDFKFDRNAIEQQQFDKIDFNGACELRDFIYKADGMEDVSIPLAQLNFSPKLWNLENAQLVYGKSDFNFQGEIHHPLAMFAPGADAEIKLRHHSALIDIDELMKSNQQQSEAQTHKTKISFDELQLSFQSSIERLQYDVYKITGAQAEGQLQGNKLSLSKAEVDVNGSQIKGKAAFENIIDFVFNEQVLQGNLDLYSEYLDLDKLMAVPENAVAQKQTPEVYFSLPEDMDIDIQFAATQLKFDPLKLNKLSGKLHLIDQSLEIHEATADAAGGKMALTGVLEAKSDKQPIFDFKYELKRLEFKNAFTSFHTISKLAPIFNFIEGFFNSTFIFQGALTKDNYPDLKTVNINGIIETLEGAIKGFKPLQELASRVQIKEFSSLNLKNTKNWISVENGVVNVSDFTKNIGDVKFTAGGNHPLEGDMAYRILIDIPSNKTQSILKTIKVDDGIKYYNELMGKIGLNQKLSTDMLIDVQLGGRFTKPTLKLGLKPKDGSGSADGGLKGGIEQLKDTVSGKAAELTENLKTKAQEEINKATDSLTKQAEAQIDKLKDAAQKEVLQKVDSALAGKAGDLLKGSLDSISGKIIPGSGQHVDSLKNKLKEWNPFKKQKK
ncbi:MAG: hypothetical protein IPM34_08835 [Saprospiraceae bacterium]|nr:hypothetical protein [Saprospiraceae bacterium]